MKSIGFFMRLSIAAIIVMVIVAVLALKFAFNAVSEIIFGGASYAVSVTPDGVSIADYIKIDDDGIEIGENRVDFSEIGELASESLKSAGITVSNDMTGSIHSIDVTEAGFAQNRYSFSADINNSLDIDVSGCDVIVSAGDSDSITVDVLESADFKYDMSTVDNTLTIRDSASSDGGRVINLFGYSIALGSSNNGTAYTGLAMIVYLPENFDGEINIASTDGEIKIGNLDTSGMLTISTTGSDVSLTNINSSEADVTTVNGRISLDNISANDISISTSNGVITLADITSKRLDAATTNAAIDISRLFGEKFTFETVNGDIGGSILGQESLFSITTETDRSAYPKSAANDRSQYKLYAKTSGGDINISFIE